MLNQQYPNITMWKKSTILNGGFTYTIFFFNMAGYLGLVVNFTI